MAPHAATKMTYEDLLLLPDDGKRHELINGEHYGSPSPKRIHQRVLQRLFLAMGNHVEAHGGGEIYIAPFDVVFSRTNVVEPDLLYISDARKEISTPDNVQGAPDLVIEVLSEGNRRYDEVTKRDLYRRYHVSEYWIVDPEHQRVTIYRGEKKTEVTTGAVTTPLLPGFSLDLAALFRD